ncbi:MAG: DUF1905 domain-containing protein [Phycisphaeraceae bacterium]|nr:DUF1905 domain-containing protein [Phycisphaeraceae bacterium]
MPSREPQPVRTTIRFSATLHTPREPAGAPWCFLRLPGDASKRLPSRGQASVEGTLNGARFAATLDPDGKGGHWLMVERELREAAGASPGDAVEVEIAPVAVEPEPEVPADLRDAVSASARAKAAWDDITPLARREWIHWVTSGKRAETRTLRIAKACDMLESGKRRPCCFDRSGMYSKSLACPEADDTPRSAARARR